MPSDTYKSNLKAIVAKVKELGGTPVLVTSMERSSGIEQDTLADYPTKVREVAAEDKVALIDLHQQSKILYRTLGRPPDGGLPGRGPITITTAVPSSLNSSSRASRIINWIWPVIFALSLRVTTRPIPTIWTASMWPKAP